MLLEKLINGLNTYNISISKKKGTFELYKKKQIFDRENYKYITVVGVYNRFNNKNYFDFEIEEIYAYTKSPILIIKYEYREYCIKIYEASNEEIINLIEEIYITIRNINNIYNILRDNISNLNRTRKFNIFKFNNYKIIVICNFKLKICEINSNNEYTSLLISNEFFTIEDLIYFIKDYQLLTPKKQYLKWFCCCF